MKTIFKQLCLVLLVVLFIVGCATMHSRWKDAESINTIAAYEEFLRQYPDGELADNARSKIEELYFKQTKRRDTIWAYEGFLRKYPQGKFTEQAHMRLKELYTKKAWKDARAKDTITAYENFLMKYPQGEFADRARSIIERLYFKQAEAKNTISAYDDFLRRYPKGMFANEARSRREKIRRYIAMQKDWEDAKSTNTVSAYKKFLEQYPTGEFAGKARSYLTEHRLEGWVQKVNRTSNILTINTAMGNEEVLLLDQETMVKEKDKILSVKNLEKGDSVSIEYFSLPNKLVSRTIMIGYSVSHCSCGAGCTCPLSRGCRAIRY